MKLKILGDNWQVRVFDILDENDDDPDCQAVTYPDLKEIEFKTEYLNLETVIHELVHAYYSYYPTSSAELTNHQVEETFCDFFGKYGDEIIKKSKYLLQRLKK